MNSVNESKPEQAISADRSESSVALWPSGLLALLLFFLELTRVFIMFDSYFQALRYVEMLYI